tara:strand:+ start:345 stop:491 length:147 start_codon:yes stop_codon:yes gene_type:complete
MFGLEGPGFLKAPIPLLYDFCNLEVDIPDLLAAFLTQGAYLLAIFIPS